MLSLRPPSPFSFPVQEHPRAPLWVYRQRLLAVSGISSGQQPRSLGKAVSFGSSDTRHPNHPK